MEEGTKLRDLSDPSERGEPTFGEKAVGITFNVGGREDVHRAKQQCAWAINQMHDFRCREDATPEQKRLASIAITELQGAQMWMVKALTWQD